VNVDKGMEDGQKITFSEEGDQVIYYLFSGIYSLWGVF